MAAEILSDYIGQIPYLKLVGVYIDAITAHEKMQNEHVDVIFLDIHLPTLKGNEFAKMVPPQSQIIWTTAYDQYAVEAFDLNATDYLLKPISFERFFKAVSKLSAVEPNTKVASAKKSLPQSVHRPYHFFNVKKKKVRIYLDEVTYIESIKDYSKIHFNDEHIITREQIGILEKLFAPYSFLRIHRSFLISLKRVRAYSATEIDVDGQTLPIGRSYKAQVVRVISKMIA